MAPQKRKATVDGGEKLTMTASRRVTRGLTRKLQNSAGDDSVPPFSPPPKKERKTKKAKKEVAEEEEQGSETTVEKNETTTKKDETTTEKNVEMNTVVIEHCKQCNRFKTRALEVQKALEECVPGTTVLVNPDKPRRGCFEIRVKGGQTFISLLDMKRPFKLLTDLNMEEVIADIITKIKA